MCTEALWIQEIKHLFHTLKILVIVFEFAMYSLELEIKFKKKSKIYFRPTYPIFFHNVSGNTAFFLYGLRPEKLRSCVTVGVAR
jgi:predicted AAA+ superfamily ATPase